MKKEDKIKSAMLGMLELLASQHSQTNEINAVQQMGISVSNAVKRENNIIVIQNQSVEFSRLIPQIVNVIRICDSPDEIETPKEEIKLIENNPAEQVNIPEKFCEWLYENKINWEEAQNILRKKYFSYVSKKFDRQKEAASFLGIGQTYFSKLKLESEK